MKLNKIFIKSPKKLNKDFSFENPAIRFRRKFYIGEYKKAEIYVCGIGYGYYYINGEIITKDKFTAQQKRYFFAVGAMRDDKENDGYVEVNYSKIPHKK